MCYGCAEVEMVGYEKSLERVYYRRLFVFLILFSQIFTAE